MRRILAASPLLFLVACGSGETSVAIVFPNAASQSSVRRLRVEAYSPDTGAATATDRDCTDFENLAREGKDPIGTPIRGDYQCLDPCSPDWIDKLELDKVPTGRQIIYVLGYATTEEDATPVLEGCTDRFDSEGKKKEHLDVEIEMKLVLPESARMVKNAGDRQVGRAGQELSVPLSVRVEADSPNGIGGTYLIPGVPVDFTSVMDDFVLLSDARTYTDATGRASVRVQLPARSGNGQIVAHAPDLDEIGGGARSEQTFSVSVTEPVGDGMSVTIGALDGTRPIALALGNLGGGAGLDLAALGCDGTSEQACAAGLSPGAPFGQSVLAVVMDLGTSAQQATVTPPPAGFGVLPAGLVIGDFAPPAGRDELAFVNSRRADCQSSQCEGAEILIFGEDAGGMKLDSRNTMTGSNAIGLSAFHSSRTSYAGIAMAAQGRSRNTHPCSRANRCLPTNATTPEVGGCPPAERCECSDCNNTNEPGVCVARDKMIDLLISENRPQGLVTYNKGGCQLEQLSCDNINPEVSTCACLDTEHGNGCTGHDGCNCKVPDRIYVGDTDAPVLPFALAAGPLKSAQDWDIVAPSIGGLELLEAKPASSSFVWKGEPIINAPIHGAAILDLDYVSEEENNDPHRADVAWYARAPCLEGSNFGMSCPIWRALPEGQTAAGCLGVYYTDGQESVFDLRTPSVGGCRRHQLDFQPDGMCTGDFNGDDNLDVALATRERGTVYIFSGDGRGGLLDPPDERALPGGGVGGPMACADVDGDGVDDLVVGNMESGAIYLLRATR